MKHVTIWLLVSCIAVAASTIAFADDLPVVNRAITLADAQKIALENNLTGAESEADARIAAAEVQAARSQARPTVSATTYAAAGDETSVVGSSPTVAPQNFALVGPKGFADQNVTAMAPIYSGDRIKSQIQSAILRSKAAGLNLEGARVAVAAVVTKAYARSLLAASLAAVAQARVDQEQEQVRVIGQKVSEGRSAPVDSLREQAELADAQQSEMAAQNDEDLAMVDLKVALGIDLSSELTLTDSLDTILARPWVSPQDLEHALSAAYSRSQDLQARSTQVDAAASDERVAKSEYAPQVYAFGMGDAGASDGGGMSGFTIGLAASIPLVDGGQRRADLNAADARIARAKADALQERQQVGQAVTGAWLSLQTATAQLAAATAGLAAAKEGYDLAVMRFEAGKSVAVERLDAQTTLTRAQANLAQAKADIISSRAMLLAAMGAGV